MNGRSVWIWAAGAWLLCAPAFAQLPAPAGRGPADAQADAGTATDAQIELPVDSPRNAVLRYLALVRSEQLDEAARFLDLGGQDQARGPELARRLSAVLDRYVVIDPTK